MTRVPANFNPLLPSCDAISKSYAPSLIVTVDAVVLLISKISTCEPPIYVVNINEPSSVLSVTSLDVAWIFPYSVKLFPSSSP